MPGHDGRRRRRGHSPRDRADAEQGLPQLPWRQSRHIYPPMRVLSTDHVEAIHLNSLRILEELGVEVMSPRARGVFKAAGADVDEATGTVRLDRGLVEQALTTTPSRFTITARNPAHRLKIGGDDIVFTLLGGAPNVHDCVRGRRRPSLSDYQDLIRLAHHFNAIQIIGNQAIPPAELPVNTRHLDTTYANLVYSDMSYHAQSIGAGRAMDGVRMMAISRGITVEQMAADPGVAAIISVNSPRRFDEAMAEGLMAIARAGQVVVVTPFTLMGAMTPVTLAGALSQQNAEALMGIVLCQLVRPGAPVVYGAYTSNVDLRSGAPAFGTPENVKANIASGQLARRYNLPLRVSPTNASNAPDAQAVYETQMALWSCVLGGANLVYQAVGWLEGGLTASFEKLVLDVEMIQHMMKVLEPIPVDDGALAFDAIRDVPTGGHFFGSPHTLERYESAFYRPLVSDWQNFENWTEAGSKTATERATVIWQQALRDYEQPPMDPAVREALDAYVARRKEEIGDGDP